jgi:hypothetical protein
MRNSVERARSEPAPAPERRCLPNLSSLQRLLAGIGSGLVLRGLLFVSIFSLAAVPPLDPDLWWHLANGRLMLSTLSIPHMDVYSFSAAGQAWVMHEWLADLGMYGLFNLGGLPLLVAAGALVVTVSAACLYWLLSRSGLPQVACVVLTLVGALAGSTAWGARPQLLNLLLAALLLVGLAQYRRGRLRAWMLPLFLWLWANLHSGFMVGLIISALFIAGEAFDSWRAFRTAMPSNRLKQLAIATALSLPLAAINPFGLQSLLFAIGTLTSPLIQNNIQEWASPDFHSLAGLALEAVVLLTLAGLATRQVTARTSELLLAFALLYLAFSSQRHVPLFVLGAAPLVGLCVRALLQEASRLLDRLAGSASNGVLPLSRSRRASLAPRRAMALGAFNLALFLVVGAGMVVYRALPNLRPAGEAAAIQQAFPVGAAQALQTIGKPARIFNYYDYGGYLIWTLSPAGDRVYIDGRVEVYGPSVFGDYLRVNYLASGWQEVITRAQADAIVLPSNHPLAGILENDPAWHELRRDAVATVFTRVGFAP